MRVLHGPVNVGNQPWALSRAERRLGIDSTVVLAEGNRFGYLADSVLTQPDEPRALKIAKRLAFGLTLPFRYDVCHFYFGQTFIMSGDPKAKVGWRARVTMADLRLARALGRKVFMTLQGCDVRLAERSNAANRWTMCAQGRCTQFQACLDHYDGGRQQLIDDVLPRCSAVFYLNPELGHSLPAGQFMPYASVEIDRIAPRYPVLSRRPRIVHAPTNAEIKGTSAILAALERLRSRFDFELVLVENRSHAEAMEIYASADLAIDQILAGWYGGFAVEMMALGKPVATYIRTEDLGFVPTAMGAELPVLRLHPATLDADLVAIFEQRATWGAIGHKARAYVERWHDPDRIASAMVAAYRDPLSRFSLPS
jgi:hypothetical protein